MYNNLKNTNERNEIIKESKHQIRINDIGQMSRIGLPIYGWKECGKIRTGIFLFLSLILFLFPSEISARENIGRMQKLVYHVLSLLLGAQPDANQIRSIYIVR